jgi:hypothetical protein
VLGAIALGAVSVSLLDDTGVDEPGNLLDQRARIVTGILNGLGYGGTHWQILRAAEAAALQDALWCGRGDRR